MSLSSPDLPKRQTEKLTQWRKLWFDGHIFQTLADTADKPQKGLYLKQWDDWQTGQRNTHQKMVWPNWSYQVATARALRGLALDKNHTLPQELTATWGPAGWADAVQRLTGEPRLALGPAQSVGVLLAGDNGKGWLAQLEVELLGQGNGHFYPDPARNTVLYYAPEFLESARAVWRHLSAEFRVGDNLDGRFRLILPPGPPYIWGVYGASATAAFYLCLRAAFAVYATHTETFSLRDEAFAITATLPELAQQGLRLGGVGGVYEKMQAAHRRRLGLVIVAESDHAQARDHLPQNGRCVVAGCADVPDALIALRNRVRAKEAVRGYEYQRCAELNWLGVNYATAQHYQMLPVLRAVSSDELLSDQSDKTHDETTPRSWQVQQWEEKLSRKVVSLPVRHTLPDLFRDFAQVVAQTASYLRPPTHPAPSATPAIPRFFLLGAPGAGKSTLCRYLAWACGTQRQPVLSAPAAATPWELHAANGTYLIPVRVRLADWASHNASASLPEYLAARRYREGLEDVPTAEQWRLWLSHGETLLLLDGLDETPDAFHETLRKTLQDYAHCPAVVTCRTVSFTAYRSLAAGWPLFTLSGLTPAQQAAFIRAYAASVPHCDAERLLTHLAQSPHWAALTANPLLLAIICLAVTGEPHQPWPETRTELYERAVRRLLNARTWRRAGAGRNGLPAALTHPGEKQAVLARAALSLWLAGGEQARAYHDNVMLRHLNAALRAEGYNGGKELAGELLQDLTQQGGILCGDVDATYFFLHLTLQEYLVAVALARHITENGWDAVLTDDPQRRTARAFLSAKAWSPQWEEIFVFLAGALPQPAALLEMLADAGPDDVWRHRLALAVRCLAHCSAVSVALAERLTAESYAFLWQHLSARTGRCVSHHAEALQTLVGCPAAPYLYRQIDAAEALTIPQQKALAQVYRLLGAQIVTPELVTGLGRLWRKAQPGARKAVCAVFVAWGEREVTPAMQQELAALLATSGPDVEAAKAVAQLGAKVATPEVIAALLNLQGHCQSRTRQAAGAALSACGAAALAETTHASWRALLAHPEALVRGSTAYTLAATAATLDATASDLTPLLPDLVRLLQDTHAQVRGAAARAVGQAGPHAARPEIMQHLCGLLRESERNIAFPAAEALARLGRYAPAGNWPAELARLSATREAARHALAKLNAPLRRETATPPGLQTPRPVTATVMPENRVLSEAEMLSLLTPGHRAKALVETARTIAERGENIATPELVTALWRLLSHQNPEVRYAVARTLDKITGQVRLFTAGGKLHLQKWRDLAA